MKMAQLNERKLKLSDVQRALGCCCGYILNGEAHWFKVSGGAEVSESEAWTNLGLASSSGTVIIPNTNK